MGLASCLALGEGGFDGSEWLDLDTVYSDPASFPSYSGEPVEFIELPLTRSFEAIERLEEARWVELEAGEFQTLVSDRSSIPKGMKPYLVRGVAKHGIGSRFEVFLQTDRLVVLCVCITLLENDAYKVPLVIFLSESPSEVEIRHHLMGW